MDLNENKYILIANASFLKMKREKRAEAKTNFRDRGYKKKRRELISKNKKYFKLKRVFR